MRRVSNMKMLAAFLAVFVSVGASAGCGDSEGASSDPASRSVETTVPQTASTEERVGGPGGVGDESGGDPGDEAVLEGVDCSAEGLDDTGEFEFTTAHYVVAGSLAALCFGDRDETLLEAWGILTDIVPPGQLADLALFGGFVGDPGEEEPTLAFVNSREDTDEFQMSVNLTEAQAYPEDFALTMVHEFAHVFTGVPAELDRTVAPEDCSTWDNGEGCYVVGSLLDEWTGQFWVGELDSLDPSAEPSAEEGQLRCDGDSGYFGAYGASHPEEDFAESFAAWVLGVPAASPGQQERYDFMAKRPGLVEFRDRAEAAGYGPQPNNFDECGLAA